MSAWLKIAAVVLEAAVAILGEWFAARKRAREEQKAYDLDVAEKTRLIDAAVASRLAK